MIVCGQCPQTIRARCIACRHFPVLLRCPAKASPVEAGLLSADRCHSLRSLLPPPAALPSLPRSVCYCSSSKPPLAGRCRRSRRRGGNFHICSPLSLFSAEAEKIQLPSEGSLGPLNDHLSQQKPKTSVILSDRRESKNLRIFVMLSSVLVRRSFDSVSLRSG